MNNSKPYCPTCEENHEPCSVDAVRAYRDGRDEDWEFDDEQ